MIVWTDFKTSRKSAAQRVRDQRSKIEQAKGGIEISHLQFPVLEPGKETGVDVTVRNTGRVQQTLQAVHFLNNSSARSAFRLEHVPDFPTALSGTSAGQNAGDSLTFRLVCQPTCSGVLRNLLEFCFDGFSIGRYITVSSGDAKLHEQLKPSAPFQRKRAAPKKKTNQQRVATMGTKPSATAQRWARDCPEHPVPRAFSDSLDVWADQLRSTDPPGLQDYCLLLQNLLWIEEKQLNLDVRGFDMEGVSLRHTASGRLLRLVVPGLAESRPSVLRGDKVLVKSNRRVHAGFAHTIERDSVLLSFGSNFTNNYVNGQPVSIEFTLARTLLKVQHEGVSAGLCQGDAGVLFPAPGLCKGNVRHEAPASLDSRWFNKNLNEEQRRAVAHVLQGKSRPAPYIIFGPPGTGKTVTLVEVLVQANQCFPPGRRILACAPSNDAANLLCKRLAQHMPPKGLIRLMAHSRSREQTPTAIHSYCRFDEDGHGTVPDVETLSTFRVIVCTLGVASKLPFSHDLPKGFFHFLAVDEAGQAFETEIVGTFGLLLDSTDGGQLVLCGDPKQLGPIVHSDHAKSLGLGMSFLERLTLTCKLYQRDKSTNAFDPQTLTKLVNNYRSHPDILELPNRLFYQGELVPHAHRADVKHSLSHWEHAPNPRCPLIFCGVEGKSRRCQPCHLSLQ